MCAHSELDLYTMLYTTAPGFPSSSSFFFHFLFSFCLGLVIGANQVFRVGLLLLLLSPVCQLSRARCRKKPFYPPLAALYPFFARPLSEKGASQSGENGRADDDWTWPVRESSLRIENKKMKSIVLCQFLRRDSRDQTKKARNHARFTWPSHNTHT